jgi:hypothetical protein
MTDAGTPAAPTLDDEEFQGGWVRSPDFRLIRADVFRFRLGLGEATFTLCTATDLPGSASANVIEEQVGVTWSWASLKEFAEAARAALNAYEQAFGPIPTRPRAGFPGDVQAFAVAGIAAAGAVREPFDHRQT